MHKWYDERIYIRKKYFRRTVKVGPIGKNMTVNRLRRYNHVQQMSVGKQGDHIIVVRRMKR